MFILIGYSTVQDGTSGNQAALVKLRTSFYVNLCTVYICSSKNLHEVTSSYLKVFSKMRKKNVVLITVIEAVGYRLSGPGTYVL